MNSTCTNFPGCIKPSAPSSCCQAIFAKLVPSGHGEMFPDCAAFTAISLPRTNRKVLLSPRSVVVIGFQPSKSGAKGNPLGSGVTAVRFTGEDVTPSAAVLLDCAGIGVQGARYVFRADNSSGVTRASGCTARNLANGIAPS